MRNLILGQYVYRRSYVHSLDPRTKLLGAMVVMVGLMFVRNPLGLIFFALFWGIVVRASRLPARLAAQNVRTFAWLLALTFVAQVVFSEGRILWTVPVLGLRITQQGLEQGAVYSFRLALLVGFAALLTLTTSPIDLADALERLLRPLERVRVPVRDLVMMISLSLRFIPTLLEEAERIRTAQLSRGARFTGSLRARINGLVPLIVPLFISAFRRAEELALAMDARCYTGGSQRTTYRELRFGRRDAWSACALLLVTGFSILAERLFAVGS